MRIRTKLLLAMTVPLALLIIQIAAVNTFIRELQSAVAFISSAHSLIEADFEAAESCVHQDADDPWDALRFKHTLAPYFEEYEKILFTPEARNSRQTLIKSTGPRRWDVSQVLVDPQGDNLWAIEGAIDLSQQRDPEDPIVRIRRIGT